VLGANGAGKTTFLKLVRGDIWPGGSPEARRYRHNGSYRVSPIGFKESTGLASPDLLDEYRRKNLNPRGREVVLTGLSNSLRLYRRPEPEELSLAQGLMEDLGVAELADASLLEMSQGQAMKFLLARALMGRPRLLFLDEFNSGLDQASRARMDRVLAKAVDQGCQVLMTTHRRENICSFISHAVILAGGRINRQGLCHEVLEPDNAVHAAAPIHVSNGTDATGRDFIFRLRNVDVYRAGSRVLRDINWTVLPGESWALTGDNGAGKSTLMALLAGELQPALGGGIERFGVSARHSLEEIRRRAALVSPEFQARHQRPQSVLETVLSGFQGSIGLHRPATAREERIARQVLGSLGMFDLADRQIHALSYGQLRRVMIARALAADPMVLLLDEPLAGLDADSRAAMLDTLEGLITAGVTMIMVTHQPDDVPPSMRRHARLSQGRLLID
jgi:molybdate transport system ATP-binding protein